MEYSVGDKIIFNKKYVKSFSPDKYITKDSVGWVESWLIGKVATITRKVRASDFYWYYIDIPDTHGYDEPLFNKITEVLVEA